MKTEKSHPLWTLFITFFKIGLFTFGGGYAMMPLFQKELVERHGWIDEDEILDIFAIAESTPGVVAVNSATFVGYKIKKIKGSISATAGVVLPSFIIISIISLFIMQFKQLTVVSWAFQGIRVGVFVLMVTTIIKLARKNAPTVYNFVIGILVFVAAAFFNVNAIILIVFAIAIGILFGIWKRKHNKNDKNATLKVSPNGQEGQSSNQGEHISNEASEPIARQPKEGEEPK